MTATRRRVEDLVLRIQSAFLDSPSLALTQSDAERRFGLDRATCIGVLDALVDGGVLAERGGIYRRHFPRADVLRAA
jgi:hypothetical protein